MPAPDRIGVGGGQAADVDQVLARQVDARARGRQDTDVGRALQDVGRQIGPAFIEQVLEIVHDQQDALAAQEVEQLAARLFALAKTEPDRLGHGADHRLARGQRCQRHKVDAVEKAIAPGAADLRGGGDGQARLARAPRADQRQQTDGRIAEQVDDLAYFGIATDEAGGRRGQANDVFAQRAQRRKG